MKIKFTKLAAAGIFVLGLNCGPVFGQGRTKGIDVSHYSPIRFNMDAVTQEDMDKANNEYHDQMLRQDPRYDQRRAEFEQQIQDMLATGKFQSNTQLPVTLPVVVHVVYNTPVQNISTAQVTSQITVLNQDFGRTNPDASQTPAPFAAVAANTGIQFCLAQRDPAGNPTTGIERRQTTVASFTSNNAVKFFAQGGLDIWDPTRYLNIWVCNLGGGLLGYGEFPTGAPSNTFGVVILYTAFGNTGSVTPPYNLGRTTTHEFSHCFNLYHIWGDDGTACTGTDFCADTPNQAGATTTCFTFPHLDACSSSPPPNAGDPTNGIMYMNYMDYSYDNCLNLFTQNQSARMNAVLSTTPYNALTTSNGCLAPTNNDAGIMSITTPNGTLCTATFTPVVVLKNYGGNALTSCTISYNIDANPPTTFNWTGNLASQATATVTLAPMTTTGGAHTFTAVTSNPNGVADTWPANDQATSNFNVSISGSPIPYSYGFEPVTWPPTGWTMNNPDGGNTWARTTQAAKTGVASAKMDNFTYSTGVGQNDDMVLLPLDLTAQTAPSLTFQVAYVYYSQTTPTVQNFTDTLQVYISTNCGSTWNSIYYKGGANLATATPVPNTNTAFVPTAAQWRLETVSLSTYSSANNAIIMFRNRSQFGDNCYIDDINIMGSTGLNHTDLNAVVSMFPNPSTGMIYVNMSLPSSQNVEVKVYDVLGQTIASARQGDVTSSTFTFDLSGKSGGMYFVEVKTNGQSITRKIVLNK